jgi:di/tricarboxylate transporter
MAIIGQACVETGIALKIGMVLSKLVGGSEKKTVMAILILGGIMAIFLNGALVFGIMLPIVDCLIVRSNGTISRKHTYFPLGITATVGNGLTAFSASSMVTCVGILTDAGYRQMGAFEPLVIVGPAFLVMILFYYFFGYRLQQKWFDYPDPPYLEGDAKVDVEYDASKYPVWKQWVTGLTLIVVIAALISGGNFGAWPIMGVCVVVLTGCINPKIALKSIELPVIITAAAAIGFSGALKVTGGGVLIANFCTSIAGPLGNSILGMSVIMMIVAALMSSVLSDNATIASTVPIVMSICTTNGWDPFPMIIAVASGLKVCQFLTPICVAPVTQTLGGGYRTKDFLKLGSLISAINAVVVIIMLAIVY